jgi:hypothetical protein
MFILLNQIMRVKRNTPVVGLSKNEFNPGDMFRLASREESRSVHFDRSMFFP